MDEIVEHLQDEISVLRERIQQLEEMLMPHGVRVPPEYRLTSTEARLFVHLASRDVASKESLMLALYSDRAGDPPEIKIVDVMVCKMRKKIAAFGIRIETIWGQGYSLPDRERFMPVRGTNHG